MLKILPILIPKNKYPNCWSGSLNISPITLNVEYSIKNKIDKYTFAHLRWFIIALISYTA